MLATVWVLDTETTVAAIVSPLQSSPALVRKMYQLFAHAKLSPAERMEALETLLFKKAFPISAPSSVSDKDGTFSLLKDIYYGA